MTTTMQLDEARKICNIIMGNIVKRSSLQEKNHCRWCRMRLKEVITTKWNQQQKHQRWAKREKLQTCIMKFRRFPFRDNAPGGGRLGKIDVFIIRTDVSCTLINRTWLVVSMKPLRAEWFMLETHLTHYKSLWPDHGDHWVGDVVGSVWGNFKEF